jgi:hypothetical protein
LSDLFFNSDPSPYAGDINPPYVGAIFLGPIISLIPICSTIYFATFVHYIKSLDAPVVTLFLPLIISSAILPPMPTQILFSRYYFEYIPDSIASSFGVKIVTPPAPPLGTIDILFTRSYSSINAARTACPAS